jgi:prevent-host-death family protein
MTSHLTHPKSWQVQDAKARFSELLDASTWFGPQIVTRRGVETAVVVPMEEWRRLTGETRKTAKDLLLHDTRRFELDMPERGHIKHRRPPDLD